MIKGITLRGSTDCVRRKTKKRERQVSFRMFLVTVSDVCLFMCMSVVFFTFQLWHWIQRGLLWRKGKLRRCGDDKNHDNQHYNNNKKKQQNNKTHSLTCCCRGAVLWYEMFIICLKDCHNFSFFQSSNLVLNGGLQKLTHFHCACVCVYECVHVR